jgi:hypothetical protein
MAANYAQFGTHFISRNQLCLCVGRDIFVTSHVLVNVANAPSVAGYCRYPPRRFIFSSSAASNAPLGLTFLASQECLRFHLDLNEIQRFTNTALLSLSGADDDAYDERSILPVPPGYAPLRAMHAKVPKRTSLLSFRLFNHSGANVSRGAFTCLKVRHH